MKVISRENVIKLLEQGKEIIETQWGGYSYSIDIYTVRYDTARKLIRESLIVEDRQKYKSPLLKYYKLAP